MQECRKLTGLVEATRGKIPPAFLFENATVYFVIPLGFEHPALGIIIGTGEPDERGLAGSRRGHDLLDQPAPRAYLHQITRAGRLFRKHQAFCVC